LLPQDEYGRFRPSLLKDIKELPDGRFVAAGNVFVNNFQISAINEFETEAFHLWLLVVDENGCLDKEECEEMIVLDSIIDYDDTPIYTIGTKWTYDFIPKQISPFEILHSYITYEITDTMRKAGKLVYKIENNRGFPVEFMYQDYKDIYFWDEKLEDFQLTYDFDAQHSYSTKWTGICHKTDTIYADAIVEEIIPFGYWIEGWGIRSIQKISISDNGSIEGDMKYDIIEYIGRKTGGLRLNLGYGLCDFFQGTIGDIRCFEKGGTDIFANFRGNTYYRPPCDTVWTEIINSTENIEIGQSIIVHPNPVTHTLKLGNIDSTIKNYQLLNLSGQIIKQGEFIDEIDVSYLPSNTYLIRIFDDSSNFKILKFIKL